MASKRLTKTRVEALKPAGKRYIEWASNGLGIRVSPKGTKTWVSMYRYESKPRMITHGRYPEITVARANALHGATLEKVEKGEDPGAERVEANILERTAPTFADLADEYVNHRDTLKKRSAAEERRVITTDLLPQWRELKLKDIHRRDVVKLLDGIVDRGAPVQANRTKSLILTMFKFGLDRGLVDDLPYNYIRNPGGKEEPRRRVLSDDEIRVFWTRLEDADAMTPAFRTAFRILLLTGARRGEIAKARITDVDFRSNEWWIPPGHSKNGRGHTLPMTDGVSILMRKLIKMAKAKKPDTAYLLPSPSGDKPITERALTRAMSRTQELFEFEEPFTVHDLRRTLRTGLGRVKDKRGHPIPREVKEHILNHKPDDPLDDTYDQHHYMDDMREALDQWNKHVRKLAANMTVVSNA